MRRGKAPLVICRTGQARHADDVTCRVDVRQGRLITFVDRQHAPLIGHDADGFQAHVHGVALTPIGEQQDVRLDALVRLQGQHHAVILGNDGFHFFIMPNQHALVSQMISQGIDDLVIQERQQAIAGIDEVHLHAEVAEHRGVFAADDARAIDGDRLGRLFEPQDRITIANTPVGEVHSRRMVRARARGEDEMGGAKLFFGPVMQSNFDGVRIDKGRTAPQNIDGVAIVERLPHRDLLFDHTFGGFDQGRKIDLTLGRDPEQGLVRADFGQPADHMAQGLAGDGAPMGATAADQGKSLDHGDLFS